MRRELRAVVDITSPSKYIAGSFSSTCLVHIRTHIHATKWRCCAQHPFLFSRLNIEPISLTVAGGTENKGPPPYVHLCWSPAHPHPQDGLCNLQQCGKSGIGQGLMTSGVRPTAEKQLVAEPKDGGNRLKECQTYTLLPFTLQFHSLWNVKFCGAAMWSCIGDALKIKRFHGEQKDWHVKAAQAACSSLFQLWLCILCTCKNI